MTPADHRIVPVLAARIYHRLMVAVAEDIAQFPYGTFDTLMYHEAERAALQLDVAVAAESDLRRGQGV